MSYRRSRPGRPTRAHTPALIGLLLLLLAGVGVVRAEILEQILVKVNGEAFTKTDLESRQVQELRQRGERIDLNTEQGSANLRKALAEITPRVLVEVVDEMLLVQRGRELGYRLSDEQFSSVLESIKTENKFESDEQFQAALKQENMSIADLRRNVERSMLMSRVQQSEIFSRVAVTEEEAKTYYEEHVGEFTTPSSLTLREILVAVPPDARGINVGAEEAASARADEIRGRLTAGEAFDTLAAEVSDAPSKANGGLIGPLNFTDLSPDFQKLIAGMTAGGLSPVIRTPRGFQILKLESRSPVQVMSFDQAREQISDRVVARKRQAEFLKYIARLRDEAIIEWKNEQVKKAYEEGLAQQATELAAPGGAL
jgi:parvulin-like peptidyl-prolyl isomerase